MRRLAILLLAIAAASPALAKPRAYSPPPETASLAPGPDVDIVDANCSACHSVDYVTTQPRRLADPKAFWSAEMTKMRKVYGYQATDEDAAKIVKYLSDTYK